MGVKNMTMSILLLVISSSVVMLIEGVRGGDATGQNEWISFRVFYDVVYNLSAALVSPSFLAPARTYRLINTSPVVQTTNFTFTYTRMENLRWNSGNPLPGRVAIEPSFIQAQIPSLDQEGNLSLGNLRLLPWGEITSQNSTLTETVPFTLIPMTETIVTINDWTRVYYIPFNYIRSEYWQDQQWHRFPSVDGICLGGFLRPSLSWQVLPLSGVGRSRKLLYSHNAHHLSS